MEAERVRASEIHRRCDELRHGKKMDVYDIVGTPKFASTNEMKLCVIPPAARTNL